MTGSDCVAIVLIWVSRKGCCECRMIRASWIGYGNLIINIQACEKDSKANVGADYFIWKPLSPYCIQYLQSTVKSRISVSIIFNHIFSLQFTRGVPVLFSTWADCSWLWKEKRMFMLMTNEQCQHMLASKPDQIWIQLRYNISCIFTTSIRKRDKSKRDPPLLNLMNVSKYIFLNEPVPSSKCENSRGWYAYS